MSVISFGTRFGKLIVIKRVSNGNNSQRKYLCMCDCGKTKITSEKALRQGSCRSCGCLRFGNGTSRRRYGEFDSESRLYRVWSGIKTRCFNPNSPNYRYYGGRGISMCDEWRDDFDKFKIWAITNGYREEDSKSIERKNVNGDYCLENCTWATRKEQSNNTRRNTFIEYKGEKKTLMQWSEEFGLNYSTFMSRYSRGWSMERIESQPVKSRRKVV